MKLIKTEFNKETGVSTVILQDKNGRYEGKAKLHPDDKDNISNYAGYHIAEFRAWIKYLKTQLSRKKAMLKAVENLKKDIQINCYENQDIEKRIGLTIRNYTEEITEIQEAIISLNQTVREYIKGREKIKEIKVKTE